MANCNYKVNLTDIQNKYKFKIFNTGSYNDSDLRKMIESVFYALPRTTGTGTSVTLNDTAFSYMKNELNATDTSQIQYNNKNILNYTLASLKSGNTSGTWSDNKYTYNGITFTINEDLTIKVNGTATDNIDFDVNIGIQLEIGTYKIVGTPNTGGSNTYKIQVIGAGTTQNETGNGVTFTTTQVYTSAKLVIKIYSGVQITDKIYKPMITTDTSLTYNDYSYPTAGNGSPSPDYPQTIHTITGNNKIKSSNSDNSLSNSVLLTLGDTEICKIGTYEDKIFKAIKGNEIYDSLTTEEQATLDYGKWYLRKAIDKIVLNGTESWRTQTTNQSGDYRFATDTYNNTIRKTLSNTDMPLIYCDMFKPDTPANNWSRVECVSISTSGDILIYYDLTKGYDATQFTTWITSNNVIAYIPYATPTNEKFNDTIQEQLEDIYNNMLSYEGQTNISQENADLPFNIEATAIKDLNSL